MRGINKTILVGHVCNNPVLSRKTHGVYLKVILATNGKRKNTDTFQMEDCTDHHTVVIPHPLAETLEPMIRKGTLLFVEGENQTLKVKHKATQLMQNFPQVNAIRVQILSKKRNHSPHPREDHQENSSQNSLGNPSTGGGGVSISGSGNEQR